MSLNKTYIIFLQLLLGSCFVTLWYGSLPWGILWPHTLERIQLIHTEWNPLLDERLPRLLILIATGASLTVSGCVVQSLFRNPLASPAILGISSGGSLAVVIVYLLGLQTIYSYSIPLAAFLGSFLTLISVYSLAKKNDWMDLQHLILAGLAISTMLVAFQGTILYALRDQWYLIQTITEWESGSSIERTWKHVHMQMPLTLVGLWGCWYYREEIDILALGEEEAKNLGVEVEQVRWRLFLCIALLTSGAIAALGNIGFFGLVLPNLLRNFYGPYQKNLIPLSILLGSFLLLMIDFNLRFFDLHFLTIGNLSAILGGIFFIFLLLQSSWQAKDA